MAHALPAHGAGQPLPKFGYHANPIAPTVRSSIEASERIVTKAVAWTYSDVGAHATVYAFNGS